MSTVRMLIRIAVILTLAFVVARAQAPQVQPSAQEGLDRMGIVGYADHMTAQPGDAIKFMVSSGAPRYRVDIVRIIHGDINPKGPGMKESVVETPTNGEYTGKRQTLQIGSYVVVRDNPVLRLTGSFTMTAWIAATRHDPVAPGGRAADGDQGILTKWSPRDQSGYGLFIENDARLAVWLGGPGGRIEKVRAETPLRPWVPSIPGTANAPRPQHVTTTSWYFVAASYDAAAGRVTLVQEPLTEFTFDPTRSTTEHATPLKSLSTNTAPLLMAAYSTSGDANGEQKVGGHFNGKIDNPRIYGRALSRHDLDEIRLGRGPTDAIASWNFSLDIPTSVVTDTSSRKLNGVAVNTPTRAVTGDRKSTRLNSSHR